MTWWYPPAMGHDEGLHQYLFVLNTIQAREAQPAVLEQMLLGSTHYSGTPLRQFDSAPCLLGRSIPGPQEDPPWTCLSQSQQRPDAITLSAVDRASNNGRAVSTPGLAREMRAAKRAIAHHRQGNAFVCILSGPGVTHCSFGRILFARRIRSQISVLLSAYPLDSSCSR